MGVEARSRRHSRQFFAPPAPSRAKPPQSRLSKARRQQLGTAPFGINVESEDSCKHNAENQQEFSVDAWGFFSGNSLQARIASGRILHFHEERRRARIFAHRGAAMLLSKENQEGVLFCSGRGSCATRLVAIRTGNGSDKTQGC